MRRVALSVGLVAVGVLGLAATPAGAKPITVGTPEIGGISATHHAVCEHGGKNGDFSYCTFAQDSPSVKSPVTGTIVTWRVKEATGQVGLKVLRGNTFLGGSTLVTPAGTGREVFPVEIPIEAGDRIGVVLYGEKGEIGEIGRDESAGGTFSGWKTVGGLEQTIAPSETGLPGRLLLNADIQPAPTITGFSPTSAQQESGTPVTITGTDFEEVRKVSFGVEFEVPFEVVSESTIVAHPTGIFAGPVPVTVTTRGGTATATGEFTFEAPPGSEPIFPPIAPIAPVVIPPIPSVEIPPTTFPGQAAECHVPKLKGKTLKQAKPLLTAAHCKLGKVTKRKGVTAKRGKVVGEIPPPGAKAYANAPVQVKLG